MVAAVVPVKNLKSAKKFLDEVKKEYNLDNNQITSAF